MLTVAAVLAAVAGILACLTLIPTAPRDPLLSVAVLLLSVALFVIGLGHG